MPLNIPNLLTWARIVLIPLFVGVFYAPQDWLSLSQQNLAATVIFVVAAVTDWFDGWLARKLDQTSAFGAFLDPVADKLMVAAALIVLVDLNRASVSAALIIIGREIAISALREWMAKAGRAGNVAVSFIGKLKTTAQMLAILLLLYHDPIGSWPWTLVVGRWLLYLAAFLTLWSMLHYLRLAWIALKNEPAA